MLCRDCESIARAAGKAGRAAAPRGRTSRLALLYCAQCGATLAPPNATETLLAKLSQLAQFGLSAGGEPILADRSGHRGVATLKPE